jgi:hypothetical protein
MRELFVSHYKEHFSSVTCVSNLDVYPTNTQTMLKNRYSEQMLKESANNVEEKGEI